MVVNNCKELADALCSNATPIVICDSKLYKVVKKIKSFKPATWKIALTSIKIAFAVGKIKTILPSSLLALVILGKEAIGTLNLCVSAGNIDILNKLRQYEVTELSNGQISLAK